jgi:hypothetical protein
MEVPYDTAVLTAGSRVRFLPFRTDAARSY